MYTQNRVLNSLRIENSHNSVHRPVNFAFSNAQTPRGFTSPFLFFVSIPLVRFPHISYYFGGWGVCSYKSTHISYVIHISGRSKGRKSLYCRWFALAWWLIIARVGQ